MRETWPNLPKVKAEQMDERIKIYSTRGVSVLIVLFPEKNLF